MKSIVLILVIISTGPGEISRINALKQKAEKAYTNGDFRTAAEAYSQLYDSLGVTEDRIGLNLAHSYYALGDTSNARSAYHSATSSPDKALRSIAYQQLGVMAKNPATLQQSLAYLKSALKADPTNEDARYNYEVVKKLLQQQQQNQDQQKNDQQNDDQENKDQEGQDQQNQQNQKDQEDQENQQQEQEREQQQDQQDQQQGDQEKESEPQQGENQDEQDQQEPNPTGSPEEKLEEMNLSEEKARMILEALKNREIQYIQQQKRKPTKPRDSGKPDW